MQTITTSYGSLDVNGPVERHADGSVKACTPAHEVVLTTSVGRLVVQCSTDDLRRKTVQGLAFYDNGVARTVSLENRTVVSTPAGPIPAELVTFHRSGVVKRVFPLNGRLSGFWSEEDEAALAEPVRLFTPMGLVTAKIIGVCFHETGALRSITLWPGETVQADTPVGTLDVRVGICFRPDGSVLSVEPAAPTRVPTPVGEISAFDPDAVGVNADANSLVFARNGEVERVATTLTAVTATGPDGAVRTFVPLSRESLCGDGEREVVPMALHFTPRKIVITPDPAAAPVRIPRAGYSFATSVHLPQLDMPFGPKRCSL